MIMKMLIPHGCVLISAYFQQSLIRSGILIQKWTLGVYPVLFVS